MKRISVLLAGFATQNRTTEEMVVMEADKKVKSFPTRVVVLNTLPFW